MDFSSLLDCELLRDREDTTSSFLCGQQLVEPLTHVDPIDVCEIKSTLLLGILV
jgi:hypothetical protein